MKTQAIYQLAVAIQTAAMFEIFTDEVNERMDKYGISPSHDDLKRHAKEFLKDRGLQSHWHIGENEYGDVVFIHDGWPVESEVASWAGELLAEVVILQRVHNFAMAITGIPFVDNDEDSHLEVVNAAFVTMHNERVLMDPTISSETHAEALVEEMGEFWGTVFEAYKIREDLGGGWLFEMVTG